MVIIFEFYLCVEFCFWIKKKIYFVMDFVIFYLVIKDKGICNIYSGLYFYYFVGFRLCDIGERVIKEDIKYIYVKEKFRRS